MDPGLKAATRRCGTRHGSLTAVGRYRSSPHTLILISIVALATLRAGSCLRVERPYPAPTPQKLIAALIHQRSRLTSLRAEARTTHWGSRGKVRGTVRMMAARDGQVRFDVVSPFDTPLATLVCRDGRFALLDARNNRHFYGPASPCNLARLLHVHLPPTEVLVLLGGSTPLIKYFKESVHWDDRASLEILTLEGEGLTQIIRLRGSPKRFELRSSEIRDTKGNVVFETVPSAYREISGIRLPRRLYIAQPKVHAALQLEFKHEEVNLALPASAFDLPVADGLPSQRVDCGPAVGK